MSDANSRRGEPEKALQQVQKLCLFCRQDISRIVYIKCSESCCKNVELCLNCFSRGLAIPPHLPTHSYQIVDATCIPIYSDDWGANEELSLLSAIEKCGLGNWTDISTYIGTKKDQECEEHYFTYYLFSNTSPLPDDSRPFPALAKICLAANPPSGIDLSQIEFESEANLLQYILAGGTIVDVPNIILPQSITHALQSSRTNHHKNKKKALVQHNSVYDRLMRCRLKQAHFEKPYESSRWKLQQIEFRSQQRSNTHISSGYLQQRNDFETEYINDAEKDIGEMDFRIEDTIIERELKLRVLELYNQVLDERCERKEFLDRYQLLIKREKRLSREESQVYKTLRPFARYLEPEEFDELVRSTVIERALRLRIEQLQTYRLNGIQTLSDGLALDHEYSRISRQWETIYRKKFLNLANVPIGQHQALSDILKDLDKELNQPNDGDDDGNTSSNETVASALGLQQPPLQQQQQQQPPSFSSFSVKNQEKAAQNVPFAGASLNSTWYKHAMPASQVPSLFSANTTSANNNNMQILNPGVQPSTILTNNAQTSNFSSLNNIPSGQHQSKITDNLVNQMNSALPQQQQQQQHHQQQQQQQSAIQSNANNTGPIFDLKQYPHAAVLSHAEQLLCRELHLLPQHYLVIKDRLIKESVQQGYITKGTARNVLKVDVHCTDKVLNFCISQNIIPSVVVPQDEIPQSQTNHFTPNDNTAK